MLMLLFSYFLVLSPRNNPAALSSPPGIVEYYGKLYADCK